ncbi:MAG: oligosaccharide flippase family protein [Mariprofundaceae bacterium]
MGGHLREVLSGAGISLLLRLLGAGAQFIFSVALARLYGADGLGVYTLALSFTVISSVLARWGLDQAALKLVAIYAEKGEWGKVRAVQLHAMKLVMLISVIITTLLLISSQWLVEYLFHQQGLSALLSILALAIIPFSGLNLIAECLRAVKKVSAYTVIQSVLVAIVAMAGVLLLDQFEIGVQSAAYAYVFACYITFFVALCVWRHIILQKKISTKTNLDLKLFETASPMAWVTIVATLMSFSETVLLGLFRSSDEIGIYSASLRFALLTSFIVIAFNSVLAPKFASLIRDNEKSMVQELARNSAVLMLLAALPLLVVFIFFPEYTLQLFGDEFEKGGRVLVILALAQMVNVGMGPAGLLLMMGGHERVMRKLSLYTWIISAGAGLLLIPLYGAIGAACSAFIGIVLLNILAVLGVRKYMGISLLYKFS